MDRYFEGQIVIKPRVINIAVAIIVPLLLILSALFCTDTYLRSFLEICAALLVIAFSVLLAKSPEAAIRTFFGDSFTESIRQKGFHDGIAYADSCRSKAIEEMLNNRIVFVHHEHIPPDEVSA